MSRFNRVIKLKVGYEIATSNLNYQTWGRVMKQIKQMLGFLLIISAAFTATASELKEEVLIGYIRNQHGMVFQVYSGGCTEKSDFKVIVDQHQDKTFLTLYRANPDYCKASMPFGRTITYSYSELNISRRQPVQVLNPINPGFIF